MTTATLREPYAPEKVPLTFIKDTAHALEALDVLRVAARVALDTETVILRDSDGNPFKRDLNLEVDGEGAGPLRVVSIACQMPDGTKRAFVIDAGYVDIAALASLMEGLRPFMWNAPFDMIQMRRNGIEIPAWDLMLADSIVRCGAGTGADARKHASLAAAAKKHLGYDLDGKGTVRLDYRTVEERPDLSEEEILYAGIDAIVTLDLAEVYGPVLNRSNLMSTFIRDCNGEPFVAGMISAGLPMLGDDYKVDVDRERRLAYIAAEQIAVATTGRELLETLYRWASVTGRTTEEYDQGKSLDMLHDVDTFAAFLTDIAEQADKARDRMGTLLGEARQADLFAEEQEATFVALPFDPDNDTDVRKYVTKQAPHFAAAVAVATRQEESPQGYFDQPAEDVLALAARRRTLTKDHPVEDVLPLLVPGVADVTVTLAGVAAELAAYRRYRRIITSYAAEGIPTEQTYLLPTWDLSSAPQTKAMFNTFAEDLVRAYMERTEGVSRLLDTADSVDGDTMKMIGGPLAAAILEYRKRFKIVSTYGDEMLKRINPVTGRVHARYKQCLTGTGRLASEMPNAQNLSPLVKPYIRPLAQDGVVRRVLVCVDLSQAELRFVADAAQDVEMLAAFRSGEDLHTRTASLMFGINLVEVAAHKDTPLRDLVGVVKGIENYVDVNAADPVDEDGNTVIVTAKQFYKTQRQKAKRVAFGYAYGLKGASLARGLTVEGVPTTKEEADELLAKFDQAYPQVAAWMAQRVAFIDNLARNMRNSHLPSGVDFAQTWLLHNTHAKSHQALNALRKTLGRTPTDEELANKLSPALVTTAADLEKRREEMGEDLFAAEMIALATKQAQVIKVANWALSYDHAVAIGPEGDPWQFESRTAGSRRRLFQVATKHLMRAVAMTVCGGRGTQWQGLRDAWVDSYNSRKAAAHAEAKQGPRPPRGEYKAISVVDTRGKAKGLRELEKVFEDTDLVNDLVGYALVSLNGAAMEKLWRAAMADRINAMKNQYRNHPIQGGVADAVTVAFADIYLDLKAQYPTAFGIQSVHDSIVIECDVADAAAVRDLVVARMQNALASFCPTVPCVADGDIQLSLDAATTVTDEQLAELIAAAQDQDAALVAA